MPAFPPPGRSITSHHLRWGAPLSHYSSGVHVLIVVTTAPLPQWWVLVVSVVWPMVLKHYSACESPEDFVKMLLLVCGIWGRAKTLYFKEASREHAGCWSRKHPQRGKVQDDGALCVALPGSPPRAVPAT